MNKPIVSAIISTYNSAFFIKGRIENLLNQTISDQLEIIIVNSGSDENEGEIVKEFLGKYPQIKYIETEGRETVYKAWNRGIKISKGKYITNANTDDRLRKDALEILSYTLDKNPNIALAYADQYITNIPNQSFGNFKGKRKFNRVDFSRLNLLSGYVAGPQSMWRASLHFNDNIWFAEEFEVSGDYDFVCRIAERYDLLRVPGILGIYYKAADNSNKEFRNFKETHKESYEVKEKYLKKYLEALSQEEIKKFEKIIELYVKTPYNIYRIVRKIISLIKPEKQIPSREFIFLFASTLEEIKGNAPKAMEYCREYIDKSVEGLIERQYNRLLAGSAERNNYK